MLVVCHHSKFGALPMILSSIEHYAQLKIDKYPTSVIALIDLVILSKYFVTQSNTSISALVGDDLKIFDQQSKYLSTLAEIASTLDNNPSETQKDVHEIFILLIQTWKEDWESAFEIVQPFTNIFQFCLTSSWICRDCDILNIPKNSPEYILEIEPNEIGVQKAIQNLHEQHIIEKRCNICDSEKCNEFVTFQSVPDVLVIHIKQYPGLCGIKMQHVDDSLHISTTNNKNFLFHIQSVICYLTMKHFVIYTRKNNLPSTSWMLFDDLRETIEIQHLVPYIIANNHFPVLLFYAKSSSSTSFATSTFPSSEPSSKTSSSISLTSSSTTSTSRSSTVVSDFSPSSSVSHAIVVTQQQKVNSKRGAFYNFNDYTERLQNADNDFSHFNNVSSLIFATQNNFADTEIVSEICSVTVKRMDFKRLQPGLWLNDEIINLYIELLKIFDSDLCAKDVTRKPTLFFSTWFMEMLLIRDGKYNYSQVQRLTKRGKIDLNILDYEQVIIPINISNSHWIINRINISEKKVIEGDSLASGTPRLSSRYTNAVMRWIADEHDSRSIQFDQQGWSQVILSASQFPHQTNNEDCGVFTLMAAEYFARGREVNFDQESMDFFRMRIAINILKKEISDDDI